MTKVLLDEYEAKRRMQSGPLINSTSRIAESMNLAPSECASDQVYQLECSLSQNSLSFSLVIRIRFSSANVTRFGGEAAARRTAKLTLDLTAHSTQTNCWYKASTFLQTTLNTVNCLKFLFFCLDILIARFIAHTRPFLINRSNSFRFSRQLGFLGQATKQ